MQKIAINEVLNQSLQSGITTLNTYQKADKSKVGRKRIPKEQHTNKIIHFYLNAKELQDLVNIASKECLSVHAFVKKEVLKMIKKERREC